MKLSDEIVMTYADGELDTKQCAQIETAMQQDADLAARIARHQSLRQHLRSEMDKTLSEPVPDHLLALLAADNSEQIKVATPADRNAQIISLPQTRRWQTREWTAMAAALIIGIAVGLLAPLAPESKLMIGGADTMIANNTLTKALDEQLATTQSTNDPVQIGISYQSRSGTYCRTFTHEQLAGVACREGDVWQVRMLMRSDAGAGVSTEYRQAGSALPTPILSMVEQMAANDSLDAEGEAAARQAGWRVR